MRALAPILRSDTHADTEGSNTDMDANYWISVYRDPDKKLDPIGYVSVSDVIVSVAVAVAFANPLHSRAAVLRADSGTVPDTPPKPPTDA